MSLNALDGLSAYTRVIGVGAKPPAGASEAAGGFAGMVEGLVGTAAKSLGAAEAATRSQLAGKGDLIDVVTAIGAAETALDTVVAVRDKMVGAYQEIMRMQI